MLRRNSRSSLLSAMKSRLDATLVDPYTFASFLPDPAAPEGCTYGNTGSSDERGQQGEPERSQKVQEAPGGVQEEPSHERAQDAHRRGGLRHRRPPGRDRSGFVRV